MGTTRASTAPPAWMVPASYVVLAAARFATANGSTATLIGAQERTMAYAFLAWVMALAVALLSRLGAGMRGAA